MLKLARTALSLTLMPLLVASCQEDATPGTEKTGNPKTDLEKDPLLPGSGPVVPPKLACSYPSVLPQSVQQALDIGDASGIVESDLLLDSYNELVAYQATRYNSDLHQLFNLSDDGQARNDGTSLTSIDWEMTSHSYLLRPRLGINTTLIAPNDSGGEDPDGKLEGTALAIVGERNSTRYAAMSVNPFRRDTNPKFRFSVVNDQFDTLMVRLFEWLARTDSTEELNVVLTHLNGSWAANDEVETRLWLDSHFGTRVHYNEAQACDGSALQGCIENEPDLLLISHIYDPETDDLEAIMNIVQSAFERGIPVWSLHKSAQTTELGARLSQFLDIDLVSNNATLLGKANAFDIRHHIGALPPAVSSIDDTVRRLKNDDFGFTVEEMGTFASTIDKNVENHQTYREQFADGANHASLLFQELDNSATNIFSECGAERAKLLALIGDQLRQSVKFPMTTIDTDSSTFLRAFFADHLVYNSRFVGPSQPNRGNYDPSDLSQVEPTAQEVSLVSAQNFRAAGVYLLPGITARVTRKDSANEAGTSIFVSPVHDTTFVFEDNYYEGEGNNANGGYERPDGVSGRKRAVPLAPGETITLNNPYGGPLQVEFDDEGSTIELLFENVGLHPYWNGEEDTEAFLANVASRTYNWIEISTENFELHSMRWAYDKTLGQETWNNPEKMAEDIARYTWSTLGVMGGRRDPGGIEEHPEVHGWADSKNLLMREALYVQHGNIDQSRCQAAGCAGNPFDSYIAFTPVAGVALHELGHNWENTRLIPQYGDSKTSIHSLTEQFPAYVKSIFFARTGESGVVPKLIPKVQQDVFLTLQENFAAGERVGELSLKTQKFITEESDRLGAVFAFFWQVFAVARHAEVVENGFHIMPRMSVWDYTVQQQSKDDAVDWETRRSELGLGRYSREEAKELIYNDLLALALAQATGLDYRDFFAMWGIEISEKASLQIADHQLPPVERVFFAFTDNGAIEGGLAEHAQQVPRIEIDGSTPWPHE